MQHEKSVITFRKWRLAYAGFWCMFLCDLVMFLFSPVFMFLISVVFHIIVFFVSLNLHCRFLGEMLAELSAQKDCAPAPAVVECSQS